MNSRSRFHAAFPQAATPPAARMRSSHKPPRQAQRPRAWAAPLWPLRVAGGNASVPWPRLAAVRRIPARRPFVPRLHARYAPQRVAFPPQIRLKPACRIRFSLRHIRWARRPFLFPIRRIFVFILHQESIRNPPPPPETPQKCWIFRFFVRISQKHLTTPIQPVIICKSDINSFLFVFSDYSTRCMLPAETRIEKLFFVEE